MDSELVTVTLRLPRTMRETYAGKIKLIYIDPPYNTGHDMIYHDDFATTRPDYESSNGDMTRRAVD